MNKNYFPSTGKLDEKRLEINNKIYNPVTFSFMLEHGLKEGMTALEIGCGYGHTAIWIAKIVGHTGRVFAIDFSFDTLEIAKKNAKNEGLNNIEFIHLDINNISSLNQSFDFCYGRWVIEFCKDPLNILKKLYNKLNPNGILIYEALNFSNSGNFSLNTQSAIANYHQASTKNAILNGAEPNLADNLFSYFKKIGFYKISAKFHQPFLNTKEQKSVYSLGFLSSKNSYITNQVLTETEFENILEQLYSIENNNDIATGFYSNLLIKGIK